MLEWFVPSFALGIDCGCAVVHVARLDPPARGGGEDIGRVIRSELHFAEESEIGPAFVHGCAEVEKVEKVGNSIVSLPRHVD